MFLIEKSTASRLTGVIWICKFPEPLAYIKYISYDCLVPIRDYMAEVYQASQMAAAGESGQSNSIKSDTTCKIRSQLLQFNEVTEVIDVSFNFLISWIQRWTSVSILLLPNSSITTITLRVRIEIE